MFDTTRLPHELQDLIWTEYRDGLLVRRGDYVFRINRVILDHIRTLCQTDANFKFMLDWMAHMLQFPYIKPQRGIVLAGPLCSGKTSFTRLLTRLLGGNNVLETYTLRNGFNASFDGRTLIILDGCAISEELPQINNVRVSERRARCMISARLQPTWLLSQTFHFASHLTFHFTKHTHFALCKHVFILLHLTSQHQVWRSEHTMDAVQ